MDILGPLNPAQREAVPVEGDPAPSITMGPFHAVCARFLRIDGEKIGIGRGFAIYDNADQQALMRRAMTDLGLDQKRYHPQSILSVISRAKDELAGPAAYAQGVRNYFEA